MQAMKMKRLLPTYVLALALAIGVVFGGMIVASALYLPDQPSDFTSMKTVNSISRPTIHRPMDE